MLATRNVEEVQRHRLSGLLRRASRTEFGVQHKISPAWDYETFSSALPVTDFSHWEPLVEEQRCHPERSVISGRASRYEPTSGSTACRKWIPYTPAFLAELDAASAPWIYDMGSIYPDILRGRHYWSLSWMPDELRGPHGPGSTDDLRLFPWWKRGLLGRTMAVSAQVALAPTLEQSMEETLFQLVTCRELSFISVWSPTFALELLTRVGRHRDALAQRATETGHYQVAALLDDWKGELSAPFFEALWPNLALVSAWDTSTSARYARHLQALLGHARFQGKGLWATEGVVTIPLGDAYLLAINSHFYEFRCLDTEEVLPCWKLEEGMVVQPILSTGSGLFRYALLDRLRVSGFVEKCPTFEFLGRIGGSDMVGEKLDVALVEDVLADVSKQLGVHAICLFAQEEGPAGNPRYVLLAEGRTETLGSVEALTETRLMEIHHYALARQMGQLEGAGAIVSPSALRLYMEQTGAGSAGQGSRKVEALGCLPMPLAEFVEDLSAGKETSQR